MQERAGAVTLRNNPFTVVGPVLNVGDKAPDFALLDNDLKPFSLKDTADKVRILSVVPSLDTPVCDQQTRRFNEEAGKLPNVQVLTISMDLPFAQKRWCGAAGVSNLRTLSDHREGSFGQAYGTLIKELRLNARAVFVLDTDGTVRHAEYVKEISEHPNYDAALNAARGLAGA
ncbi:MAG: thiol peroxidase [Gammaproteobacteria bacterium]